MPNISWMPFRSLNNQEFEVLKVLFYEEEVFDLTRLEWQR